MSQNRNSSKIINIGSIFGSVSSDFRNYTDCNRKSPECYGASKAGLIQMTKYFAVHLAQRDISVNCISPGGSLTRITYREMILLKITAKNTDGRMADVNEIVEVIDSIIKIKTNYLTGQNIVVMEDLLHGE